METYTVGRENHEARYPGMQREKPFGRKTGDPRVDILPDDDNALDLRDRHKFAGPGNQRPGVTGKAL